MGKNKIYLVIIFFFSLPLLGITFQKCSDRAGNSISCGLADNGWDDDSFGDDVGWDKPTSGDRKPSSSGGDMGWDTDLDEPKEKTSAGTEEPTQKGKPEDKSLAGKVIQKKGQMEAVEKFKAGSGGLLPEVPAIPFASDTDKSFEGTAAVKYLGTSMFVLCQQQSQAEWDQIVAKYAESPKDEMWNESWWSLAKSIEQNFENFRLTEKEVRAL
ncbi:MAG: hypothetical protein E2O68_01310, partial [Deltaproteobacteria bacterium]